MKAENHKLLFIHPGGLGDVILLSPVLKLLKEKYLISGDKPQIDLLVEKRAFEGSKEFFALTDSINEVKVFDFKGKTNFFQIFDLIRLLQGYSCVISSGSSPLVSILLSLSGAPRRIGYESKLSFLLTDAVKLNKNQYASFMSADLIEPLIGIFNKEEALPSLSLESLKVPVSELCEEKYILIHPGVSSLSIKKNIIKAPGFAFWKELINKLTQKYTKHKIVLIGGPDERETAKQIVTSLNANETNFLDLSQSNFSLGQLAELIKFAEVFICADSAPLHLSVAVQAKTVALFGPTEAGKLVPKRANIKVIKTQNLECQPCLWNRRSQSCNLPLCVELLEPESVLKGVRDLLNE